jgi:WD40 repeat protein
MYSYNINSTYIANSSAIPSAHSATVGQILQINANQVATASADHTVKVWDIATHSLVNTYNGHTDQVRCLAVLPGGLLATGSWDSTFRVWDMQAQTVRTVNVANPVWGLKMNPVYGNLVVSMKDLIAIYDPITFALVKTISTGRIYYSMEILLPSGDLIMAGDYMDVYSLPSGSITGIYYLINDWLRISTIKLLPDNVTLVCGLQYSGFLELVNTRTNYMQIWKSAHSGDAVTMLSMTPDLTYLVSGAQDNSLIIWTWSTMSLTYVKTFPVAGQFYAGLALKPTFTESKNLI